MVGRPNVGKSTLFNRLTGRRHAIVTSVPGTTRDLLEGGVEWQGCEFTLFDTGGVLGASEDPMRDFVAERMRKIADAVETVAPSPGSAYKAVLQFQAPVEQLVNFVHRLETDVPWLHASALGIRIANPEGPMLSVTLTLEATIL